ncbi:putative flippase GtrA [Streptomyces olivoverticillatus]|uniref:Putative flippase GtrA n=2 Tax=Streptomyces olivoverticillatus TaxID=66427 RepID=A0A7W7LKW9_9ACTN|nr:putative flippase GtrA [Streptomyces olivoverticillatus]
MRPTQSRGKRTRGRLGLMALGQEFAKFGTVGGLGIFVNLGVFNVCRGATHLPVVRCSVIATVVAIAFNYLGLRYFTYRDRDKTRRSREVVLFAVFSTAGLIIENGVLYTATYGFGWGDSPVLSNLFKFLGIGTATLFRFWSYRAWVFRTLPRGGPEHGSRHGDPTNSTSNPAAYQPETTAPPP